jgi:hypothetical protein
MTKQSRIAAFGGSSVLVVAGIACAVAFGGLIGPLLALVLIGTGLVLATSLVFFEVGLSEDRERARELTRVRSDAKRGRLRLVRHRGDHRSVK